MKWEMVKLGEVCEINMGKTPSRNIPDYWGGKHLWASISDLKGSYCISSTKERITDLAIKETGIKPVKKGTLLYSFKLSIGKVAITEKELFTNEAIVALPIIDESKVDTRYLYYAVQQINLDGIGDKAVKGITLNKEKLKELTFPLPPLATQQRIADILDKADALRRKDQALLQKYDELAQAVFVDMFGDPVKNEKGWEVKFLRDCFSSKPRIGTIKPVTSDGTIKVVRVSEIGKLNINLEKSKKVIIEKNEKERYLLQENDIVLARAIGSIDHLGKASLVKNLKEDVVFDSHVMRLQFNQKLLNSYFFYTWLQSPGGRKIFLENSSQTAVQFNINAEQISRIKIAVPPINIQCKFEKSILDIYQQITFLNLSHSTALFQSLLQKAFTGELVP